EGLAVDREREPAVERRAKREGEPAGTAVSEDRPREAAAVGEEPRLERQPLVVTRVLRIGVVDDDLLAVAAPAAVGVAYLRFGPEGLHLLAVGEPVAVGVRVPDVRAERELLGVREAVAVEVRGRVVRVERIEAGADFDAVRETVAV